MRDDERDRRSGRNGSAPRNGANGVRPHCLDGLGTRTIAMDALEEPVDLVAVQADDELVSAVGAGIAVSAPGAGRYDADDRLVSMLAAWRAEVDATPIPELVDLDTAVAAVAAGVAARRGGSRHRRSGQRARHLAPLAAAACLIVATVIGVGLGSKDAEPGDPLWAIQKVFDSEYAASVEAKQDVEARLDRVRTALESGDTETAAREFQAIDQEISVVRDQEGQDLLAQERAFLGAKLADATPGTPVDLSTPATSDPTARPTASSLPPPSVSTQTSSPVPVESGSQAPQESSSSLPPSLPGQDPRSLVVPGPTSGGDAGETTAPSSGTTAPQETASVQPSTTASSEGGADGTPPVQPIVDGADGATSDTAVSNTAASSSLESPA
jgi:hypothetical protein